MLIERETDMIYSKTHDWLNRHFLQNSHITTASLQAIMETMKFISVVMIDSGKTC